MKKLTCEICGSTDLMKQEGSFVCQSCGCKYSLEEAKKLMKEYPDEVSAPAASGNVPATVPESAAKPAAENTRLDNLRQLAKRAKDSNDSENAAKFYSQILLEDPDDWQANFYTVYYEAHNIKIAQIGSAAIRVTNCFEPVLNLVKKNEGPVSQKLACMEIATKTAAFENMLMSNAANHAGSSNDMILKNINNWVVPALTMLLVLGDKLLAKFQDYILAESLYSSVQKQIGPIYTMTSETRKLSGLADQKLRDLKAAKEKKEKEEAEAKAKKEKQERLDRYWSEHAEEKVKLENEQADLNQKAGDLAAQIAEIDKANAPKIKELSDERDRAIPEDAEVTRQREVVRDLERQISNLGMFKGKEKKELRQRLENTEMPLLEKLRGMAGAEKERRQAEIDRRIADLREDGKAIRDEYAGLKKRLAEIAHELTKDR